MKTYKFHGNGQIPQLGSKFRVLQKTVVPNDVSKFMRGPHIFTEQGLIGFYSASA